MVQDVSMCKECRYDKIEGYSLKLRHCKKCDNYGEKQMFQLGDIAYMIDDDYRFFENEVYRIELKDEKYYYDTHDIDFEFKDIGDWVFESKTYRELHLEAMT